METKQMTPIEFKEQNKVLTKPRDMTDEQCKSLPCFTNGECVVSCWQMTWRERVTALLTGKVWISVRSGHTAPPISLMVDTPFQEPNNPQQHGVGQCGQLLLQHHGAELGGATDQVPGIPETSRKAETFHVDPGIPEILRHLEYPDARGWQSLVLVNEEHAHGVTL